MNSVCQDEISTRPAGADFTLRLHREIKFHPSKAEQFSTWFYLDLYNFFFSNFSCNDVVSLRKIIDSEAGTRGVFNTKN